MPDTNPSREPGLSIRLDAGWFAAILRADQVRRDTLMSLVASWGDPDVRDDIIVQLDSLAEAVQSPRDGELDSLLDAVEGAAAMDDAEIRLDLPRMLRLRAELDHAIETAGRFNPKAAARPVLLAKVPGQGRGAAA